MSHHIRTTAGLVVAGLALAAYPALRPYGPETGLEGAADFGATAWLVSHVLGMVGFFALALALRFAATGASWRWTGRPVRRLETGTWWALALLLPYYGAEAYGLNAVGSYATEHGDPGVLEIADSFRYAPFEVTTFGVGLVVLGVVGALLAHGLWSAGPVARLGGVLSGVGLMTYLPQFFVAPGLRVAHGAVLGLGLVVLAVATTRTRQVEAPRTSAQVATPA